jgi:hypothetical protein
MTSKLITTRVPAGIPSREWQRTANTKARVACAYADVKFEDAEILVELPEAGRYFYKAAGALGLGSVG